MNNRKLGPVYDYFRRDVHQVVCKICPQTYPLSTAKSSSKSLWSHLRSKHNIEKPSSSSTAAEPPQKKQKLFGKQQQLIISYAEKKSQQQMYADLVCIDRLSFHQVASSDFIQTAMREKKLTAHSSHNTIRCKVFDYFVECKEDVKAQLSNIVEGGGRFSISFDEYTGKNRRYLTVNIHSDGDLWYNLGMVRVWGSQTAETIATLVTNRLAEYGLTFDHIIAAVTDGASIMVKLGRLLPCEHVICLSHTLHLVITDVLYKKKKKTKQSTEHMSVDGELEDEYEEEELFSDEDIQLENDQEQAEPESDDEEMGSLPHQSTNDCAPKPLKETIHPVIAKVRYIVNKFRRSPVKNDLLQKIVKAKFNKELTLLRDWRTRWSSMVSMLQRYISIEEAVNETLKDLELEKLQLSTKESGLIKDIIAAVEPFKVGTEYLCSRKCNLNEAEGTIKFIIGKLTMLDSQLGKELLDRLNVRYFKRRNYGIVSQVKFFENPQCLGTHTDNYDFRMPSKATVIRKAKGIYERLFSESVITAPDTEDSSVINLTQSDALPLAAQLNNFLKNQVAQTPADGNTFYKEVGVYISGLQKTKKMELLHRALLVIPPTSVEAERVFSAAGQYLTKIRTRLGDCSLDKLIFLRFFLLGKQKKEKRLL